MFAEQGKQNRRLPAQTMGSPLSRLAARRDMVGVGQVSYVF
jgi:hypothetical protein